MTTWRYTTVKRDVVYRVNLDESVESCLVTRADVQAWIALGNTPGEPNV